MPHYLQNARRGAGHGSEEGLIEWQRRARSVPENGRRAV